MGNGGTIDDWKTRNRRAFLNFQLSEQPKRAISSYSVQNFPIDSFVPLMTPGQMNLIWEKVTNNIQGELRDLSHILEVACEWLTGSLPLSFMLEGLRNLGSMGSNSR